MTGGAEVPEPLRPSEVLRRATDYLERHGVESPAATAERLLMHVIGTDRAGLFARARGLDAREARMFGRALCQRCSGIPLQHLTGEQQFRRLELEVRPGVFVPRPETEVLVQHALDALDGVESPVAIDVGTGSGAVALSLKDERPDARVFATDRLALDLWCIEPHQATPVLHLPDRDVTYTVVGGRSWFVTDEGEVGLDPMGSMLVPAGVVHGIDNHAPDPLIVVAVSAPPSDDPEDQPTETTAAAIRLERSEPGLLRRAVERVLGPGRRS